jgi:multiple sugar transport system substrate-binding protein
MAAATENIDSAWTFIEFANSEAGQNIVARSGRTVPSLVAVAESNVFLDPALPPENSRVFIDTIPLLEAVPTMSTWVAIEDPLSREIERAYYGAVSVYEAALTAIGLPVLTSRATL